jgi:hypothetical protein
VEWSSRGHRKGVFPRLHNGHPIERPRYRWIGWDWLDISSWVAWSFVLGSVMWCANGILVFCLFALTGNGVYYASALTAFMGGSLFEVGAWLAYWEALNPESDAELGMTLCQNEDLTSVLRATYRARAHFGKFHDHIPFLRPGEIAVVQGKEESPAHMPMTRYQTVEEAEQLRRHSMEESELVGGVPSESDHESAHLSDSQDGLPGNYNADKTGFRSGHSSNSQSKAIPDFVSLDSTGSSPAASHGDPGAKRHLKWKWWGYREHDLGFLAAFLQLIGATIFAISVVVGLPYVLPHPSDPNDGGTSALSIALYWTPQVLGAPFFVISGTMFMLETQPTWYALQPWKMGWHVGFWNLLGGIGFFLCGVFGYWAEVPPGTQYQYWGTAFSTFWGSWFFLLGSYLQLLETLNKHHH